MLPLVLPVATRPLKRVENPKYHKRKRPFHLCLCGSQTLRTRSSSSVGSHVFSELRSYLYTLMFLEIHVISRLHPGEFRFTQLLHLLNAGQMPHSSRFHFRWVMPFKMLSHYVPYYPTIYHYIHWCSHYGWNHIPMFVGYIIPKKKHFPTAK